MIKHLTMLFLSHHPFFLINIKGNAVVYIQTGGKLRINYYATVTVWAWAFFFFSPGLLERKENHCKWVKPLELTCDMTVNGHGPCRWSINVLMSVRMMYIIHNERHMHRNTNVIQLLYEILDQCVQNCQQNPFLGHICLFICIYFEMKSSKSCYQWQLELDNFVSAILDYTF